MKTKTSAHLDNETLLRWQMDDVTELERTHVAECSECEAQAKPLKEALSWFGAAARQWGEERAELVQEWHASRDAAVQEWRESKTAAARSWRSMTAAWAVVSVALLLIFAVGVPRWKAHQAAMVAQVQQRQQQQQQQKQELTRDDALLEEVDQDVSQEVPEALQPLSWNSASGNTTTSSADSTVSRQ
jgi:hypothetical protein